MSISSYTLVVSELVRLVMDYLKRKKASEQEIRELQKKLVAVIKLTHDSAVDVLSYILPLKTAVTCSTHSEELQRIIRECTGKSSGEIEDAVEESFWNLRGRVDRRLRSHIHEIHRFREDFENAREYNERVKKHIQTAYDLRRKDKRLCLDALKMAEEELDALVDYLSKRITEQITPLIETYENLTEQ